MHTYQSFIFGEQDCDTSVDLTDSERYQHVDYLFDLLFRLSSI